MTSEEIDKVLDEFQALITRLAEMAVKGDEMCKALERGDFSEKQKRRHDALGKIIDKLSR
jgi:hypothetical protein